MDSQAPGRLAEGCWLLRSAREGLGPKSHLLYILLAAVPLAKQEVEEEQPLPLGGRSDKVNSKSIIGRTWGHCCRLP